MRRALASLLAVLALVASAPAQAAPSEPLLPFKAKVALAAGKRYTFRFSLFDSAAPDTGTELWRESRAYVLPASLTISHALGSVVPFSEGMHGADPGVPAVAVDFSQQLWVQVSAGTFVKRFKLTATPYAFWSATAAALDIECAPGQILVVGLEGAWECGDPPSPALCADGDLLPCYGGPAGTLGVGPCTSGYRPCASGAWGVCAGETLPGTEVCDGVDNDCDTGSADGSGDPLGGAACDGPDSDLCAEGVRSCVGGSLACSDNTGGAIDLCNGVDDDCDAASPDGAEDPVNGTACDGPDSDLCNEGTRSCSGGALLCSDATSGTLDLCNLADDDCDASSADGSEDPQNGAACDGPDSDLCAEGVRSCVGGSLACSDNTGGAIDLCNGVDDDCDAASADGAEDPVNGTACDGPDSDLCNEGTRSCSGGALLCSDHSADTIEICIDGLDNDCDGATDLADSDCAL